jgi:hypothetical protein
VKRAAEPDSQDAVVSTIAHREFRGLNMFCTAQLSAETMITFG